MGFDFLDLGFPKSGTDWKSINGKPYITVSAKGRSNQLSNKINDGADFGPDTTLNATSPSQTGASYTQTSGIQEAINYVYNNGGGRVFLRNGTYKLNMSQLTQGVNIHAAILIPPTVAMNPIIPIIIEGESSLLGIYENGPISIPPQLPNVAGGVIIDGSSLPNNFPFSSSVYAIIGGDYYTTSPLTMSATEVIIKNIYVIAPPAPTLSAGIYLYNTQSAEVNNVIVGVLTNSLGTITEPSTTLNYTPVGLYMPGTSNNGKSNATNIMIFGWSTGMWISTHFVGNNIFIAYCIYALYRETSAHAAYIGYVDIEDCQYIFATNNAYTQIELLDIQYVNDSTMWTNYSGFTTAISGLIHIKNIHIIESAVGSQPFSSYILGSVATSPYLIIDNFSTGLTQPSTPSVPTSGTAQQNTNPYPVNVYLYGGTVTEIQLTRNGTAYTVFSNATGLALSGQVYKLNPSDSITITYTSAPTWEWLSD